MISDQSEMLGTRYVKPGLLLHHGKMVFLLKILLACFTVIFGAFYMKNYLSRRSHTDLLENSQKDMMVMFNVIPKTGYETFLNYGMKNLLEAREIPVEQKSSLTDSTAYKSQGKLVEEASFAKKPVVWYGDFLFLNFPYYSFDSPIWISYVCDPIRKFKGHFLGRRSAEKAKETYDAMSKNEPEQLVPGMTFEDWKNRDFNKCILDNDPECNPKKSQKMSTPIRYFCGFHSRCSGFAEEWALSEAIDNVEKYYNVIGVHEYPKETVQAFQNVLPYYFKGLQKSLESHFIEMNSTDVIILQEAAKEKLEKTLSVEYEFYNYLVEKIKSQAYRK